MWQIGGRRDEGREEGRTVFWASIERRADGLENPTFGREWISAIIKLLGRAPDVVEMTKSTLRGLTFL